MLVNNLGRIFPVLVLTGFFYDACAGIGDIVPRASEEEASGALHWSPTVAATPGKLKLSWVKRLRTGRYRFQQRLGDGVFRGVPGAELIPVIQSRTDIFDLTIAPPKPGRTDIHRGVRACNRDDGPCRDSGEASLRLSGSVDATLHIKTSAANRGIETNDRFGHAVALSADGNTLAVGATGKDSGAEHPGAVYVFAHNGRNWVRQKHIRPPAGADSRFGHSVSLSADGNMLAVGAVLEGGAAADSGTVYVYTRTGTGWSQQPEHIQAFSAGAEGECR